MRSYGYKIGFWVLKKFSYSKCLIKWDISLQQNVFLVTKISEEIFFVTKNTALVTKYEFRH